jgi:hypothetical protein
MLTPDLTIASLVMLGLFVAGWNCNTAWRRWKRNRGPRRPVTWIRRI